MAALAMVHCAQRVSESTRFQQIVGNSPALQSVLEQVQLVGPTDSTVLILGETGTGKELIARAQSLRYRTGERATLVTEEFLSNSYDGITAQFSLMNGRPQRALMPSTARTQSPATNPPNPFPP